MSKRNKGRRTMLSLIGDSGIRDKYAVGMYIEEDGSEDTAFILEGTDDRECVREVFLEVERMWDVAGLPFSYRKGGDRMVGVTDEGLTLCVEVFSRRGGEWR